MDVQKCELKGSDKMSGRMRVGPPGFEPESMAPEATRIPSYPTGPRDSQTDGRIKSHRERLLQTGRGPA